MAQAPPLPLIFHGKKLGTYRGTKAGFLWLAERGLI
jgi:hypothetical protein